MTIKESFNRHNMQTIGWLYKRFNVTNCKLCKRVNECGEVLTTS